MHKLAIASLLVFVSAFVASAEDPLGQELQRSFAWLKSAPTGTQVYAAFRKTFELAKVPDKAQLSIFADSRYILWINGQYVDRGPCRFDPKGPEYDVHDVAGRLQAGKNAIVVLVHHYTDGKAGPDGTAGSGEGFCGRIMRHPPGLTACLEYGEKDGAPNRLFTDETWRGSTKTRFKPSAASWGSIPDDMDARLDAGDWTQTAFDDAAWEPAVKIDGTRWGPLAPRAIPLLEETECVPREVIRPAGRGALELPLAMKAKEEVLIDAGHSLLAYDVIEMDAEPGARLEILHGEGFRDGKLDEVYGSNVYIAKEGRQTYMAGDTNGFRYVVFRVTDGAMTIRSVKFVERRYPFRCTGRFKSNDAALDELWARSLNTILLCSEDGYEDCNSRERTEWMGDAALSEYPVTRVALGDSRLIRNMLRHIAMSQQPGGWLKAHHPSDRWDIHGYIEDYACLWVKTLRAYYESTGDKALVLELWPVVKGQVHWFLKARTKDGLVKAREFVFFDNPLAYKTCEGTAMNAYVYGALNDAAWLADLVPDPDAKEEYLRAAIDLKAAVNGQLWDEDAKTYRGGILEDKKTEPTAHAAMVALYFDLVPQERRGSVLQWMIEHRQQVKTPYCCSFVLDALFKADTPETDVLALNTIRERWAPTLARKDLDTVFEGFDGGALCHNMGAVASYFLSAYTLGVGRDGALENRKILVAPHLGDLRRVEGIVETEFDAVPVSFEWTGGTDLAFTVTIPARVQAATMALPVDNRTWELVVDKKPVVAPRAQVVGRRVLFEIGPGTHEGRVHLAAP